MKKYLNLVVGAAAAALTFVWFALPALVANMMGMSMSINAYDLISFEGNFKTTLFALCAIALMLIAVAVLVLTLLRVLKVDVKVDLVKLTRILLIVAAVLAVACLVIMLTETGNGVGIGISMILTAVTYIAAVVCNFVVKEN